MKLNRHIITPIKLICLCLGFCFGYGCSTQKDNATNRGLQNLSARYNFIYNSNVLLNNYQDGLAENNADNYDHILPVYIAPQPIDYLNANSSAFDTKTLDEIAQKAQTIIAEKGLSNYVDEAYMLLTKTNFYQGSYFTATAYADYVARAYATNIDIFVDAMNWKARSLMQLNDDRNVAKVIDTIGLFLEAAKKGKAEPLATLAQMSINQQNFEQAASYLERAIKSDAKAQQKSRWWYILAQLYEHEKQFDQSLRNYTKVEKSNAPFEMYFNAKLSKIRIADQLNNQPSNRRLQLLKLLKDDKNLDYTGQIYYEVAEDYLKHQDLTKAEQYYKLSAQNSAQHPYHKGLTYLKLADLNFKELGNYVNAKLYYDSATTTLPKSYPGYEAIVKKSQNLTYLTERYEQIAQQDTLQSMAKLPKEERLSRMEKMFARAQQANTSVQPQAAVIPTTPVGPSKSLGNETFYFGNLAAISTGYTDFKRKWGSRPLEDNWRQSIKSSAQLNQQQQANVIGQNATSTIPAASAINQGQDSKFAAFEASLPTTPALLKLSDQKIIDAYFEIAGFYQQELNDPSEAAKVYEKLLARYPENNHLEAIYYSLHLAYANTNKEKSEQFKNKILTGYPNSVYAKTILDPTFSTKQNALDLVINKTYNSVFDSYVKKDFPTVIATVNETNRRFPGNSLQAQYDYLKAIAIGRTQPVDSLLQAFNSILIEYPNDRLINPLVKDHLTYIKANLPTFKARKIALIDFDPTEPRFISQNQSVAPKQESKVNPKINDPIQVATVQPPTNSSPKIEQPSNNPAAKTDATLRTNGIDNFFSKEESNTYYYVVTVNDLSFSVSSSRFGIGQFNRGNYSGTGIKHQLLELEEDQLIFVGPFESLTDVKTYSSGINPQLSKIMKVPAATYKWFYISKENFDRIKNRETLNLYLEFFKNNY